MAIAELDTFAGVAAAGGSSRPAVLDSPVLDSPVLDSAHVGDIRGALGTIRASDTARRRTFRHRLLTLLAIMGPGLIVMVGDNDAGGVATYAQAGQNYGTSLLWTLLLLVPVLIVNQEMCVRLGAVTGVGHARLILERFGKFWGAFSVGDLFILNFLTLVTEFIGVSLALSYFGVSPLISVPLAALALIAVTVTGSFRRWERFMYAFILVNLVGVPLALLAYPDGGSILHDSLVPSVKGGLDGTAMLLMISIVGTTVAPWQLFFQQSNVIDKRITPRWIGYERLDTSIGAFVVVFGAAAIMVATATVLGGGDAAGGFTDALGTAVALTQQHGSVLGSLFAVLLLDASIIGAAAVTLATSYAFGDVFGMRHSLHRSFKDARFFYGSFTALVAFAAAIVLIPNAPLGLMTMAVQALAGVLLPSATVFLLLLCNDRDVLGPWVNPRWLNVVASLIVGVLLLLSLVLVVTTLFPGLDAGRVTLVLGSLLSLGLLGFGAMELRSSVSSSRSASGSVGLDRDTWRMPPLALLDRPAWSTPRKLGMLVLRGYLVIAAILLAVKVVQLALGQ